VDLKAGDAGHPHLRPGLGLCITQVYGWKQDFLLLSLRSLLVASWTLVLGGAVLFYYVHTWRVAIDSEKREKTLNTTGVGIPRILLESR
jgi:hypothetical protein